MPRTLVQTKHFHLTKQLRNRLQFIPVGAALPTIAEFMEEYGVSQATVNRALSQLRKEGLIDRPAGRKRFYVDAIQPTALHRVALIRPSWPSPDYDGIVRAVVAAGTPRQFAFHIQSYADLQTLNLNHSIRDQEAALFIATPEAFPERLREALRRPHKPVIFLRGKPANLNASAVGVDNLEIGRLATRHLTELGHRRILALLSEPASDSSSARLAGWREIMQQTGIADAEELAVNCTVRAGEDALANCYQKFLRWLDAPHPDFTAIFCVAWTGALAATRALHERGLTVPGDVSLITFDSEARLSPFFVPPLTTVEVDVGEYAKQAIDLVEESLMNAPSPPRQMILKPRLVVRGTTAPRIVTGKGNAQ